MQRLSCQKLLCFHKTHARQKPLVEKSGFLPWRLRLKFFLAQTILWASFWIAQSAADPSSADWKLVKNHKTPQIEIYTRSVVDSKYREFLGVTLVQASISSVVSLLADAQACQDWIHNCVEYRVLSDFRQRRAEIYGITDLPWPFKDRDFLAMVRLSQDPADLTVRLDFSPLIKNASIPTHKKYIRMNRMRAFWQIKPLADGQLEVSYGAHAEPGGGIPAWLANSFVVDTPYKTLLNLHRMLAKPKYQQAKLLEIQDITPAILASPMPASNP